MDNLKYFIRSNKITLIIICVIIIIITSLIIYDSKSDSSTTNNNDVTKEKKVYICNSLKAVRYHAYPECKGLRNCKADVIYISLSDALAKGFTPCKLCY